MRIGILGTGALGSLFAAKLAPWADVTVFGTWADAVRAIEQNGIRLSEGGREVIVPVKATCEPRVRPRMDLALVLVKANQTSRAAQWAQMILGADGLALGLQNGLGNLEILSAHLGTARAALGVTLLGATLLGAGYVHYAARGQTYLAVTEETGSRLKTVAELFNEAGIVTELTHDVRQLIWGKLVVNSGINALTAVLGVRNGWLVENANARAVMEQAARETAAVAAALGVTLPFDDPARRTLEVARATADNQSSMLQDIRRGALTEIETINGAVVREAKRLGVPTPVNDRLLELVRAIEHRAGDKVGHQTLFGTDKQE